MKKQPPPKLREVLPLALEAALYKAAERAKETKTYMTFWQDNQVIYVQHDEIDAFLQKQKNLR